MQPKNKEPLPSLLGCEVVAAPNDLSKMASKPASQRLRLFVSCWARSDHQESDVPEGNRRNN
jgi:hypothetical protein